jgi:hypothetical protein
MDPVILKKQIDILRMISEDQANDVKEFNGKPFSGATLGALHGNMAAAIDALAKMLQKHLEAHLDEEK